MEEKIFKFKNVTIIDKSSHEERTERLKQPLIDFYIRTREELEHGKHCNNEIR